MSPQRAYHLPVRVATPQPRVFRSTEEQCVGAWRSLVAHLHGVQGVPSSNLGAPTTIKKALFSHHQIHEKSTCGHICGHFQETHGAPKSLKREIEHDV